MLVNYFALTVKYNEFSLAIECLWSLDVSSQDVLSPRRFCLRMFCLDMEITYSNLCWQFKIRKEAKEPGAVTNRFSPPTFVASVVC
jgi:hypothetical protein